MMFGAKPYGLFKTVGMTPPFDGAGRFLLGRNERTSAEIAALAARGLTKPETLSMEEIQAVCGSALTQAPDGL